MTKRRRCQPSSLIFAFAAMLLWASPSLAQGPAAKSLTVVELYTSQGCSSCPPADAYLGKLAARDDLLALSFHVDYWDYIGWKDTNALPGNAARQRQYAKQFGVRYVYTPQMVIQGTKQVTGSDKTAILEHINAVQEMPRIRVSLAEADKNHLSIAIEGQGRHDEARILLVAFDTVKQTKIRRGENRGKDINYHNVVRHLSEIGTWHGPAQKLTIPVNSMSGGAYDACAVLLQSTRTGQILGAAKLALR